MWTREPRLVLGRVLLRSTVFKLVELVEFFRVLLVKTRFRLVWLINFFNRHQTRLKRLKRLKKHWQQPLSFTRAIQSRLRAPAVLLSGLNLSTLRSLVINIPRSYRKRLEKCSIGKPQPKQVAVETVDPNRTRLLIG